MNIDVVAAANCIIQEEREGKMLVVIDAFRATSTICTALGNGCREVFPVYSVEEALRLKSGLAHREVILGGEVNSLKIEGFDMGNSPLEYSREQVEGKTLVITTTNGTKAVRNSAGAARIIIAAFINAAAVARCIAERSMDTIIVCAGTGGKFTMEDALCAGMIVEGVKALKQELGMSDLAILCEEMYRTHKGDLRGILKDTRHFRHLMENHFEKDIEYCLQENITSLVPFVEGDRIIV